MQFLSLATLPVEVLNADGQAISRASAFLYESQNSELFLVTNWHVVTGRAPSDPSHSETGAVPYKLKCMLHARQDDASAIRTGQLVNLEVPINSDDGNEPQWLEHPDFRSGVDVVAVKLDHAQIAEQCKFHMLNHYEGFEPKYSHEAMDDVVVIGYPWGLSGSGGALPIFKRGSIASEPAVDYLGLPRFLIDCRTSPAMSGSPVIVQHSGIWNPGGSLGSDSIIGTVTNFVGVYSGRLVSNEIPSMGQAEISEIGIVWKKDALDAVVNEGVTATPLKDIAAIGS